MTDDEPTIALVFSPESWVEELHRHLADHGGARVRQIVVEPSAALEEEFDTLVVSDRWPALTRAFVAALHERNRSILGVFDPDEPAGEDHLVALGVEATVPSDAPVRELVGAIAAVARTAPSISRSSASPTVGRQEARGRLVAVTGARGSGVTEVAVALAAAAARVRSSVVLVDAHETAPALAGRLGLGLEPNLRTAVDACVHGLGTVGDAVVRDRSGSAFDVVGGFPSAAAAAHVTPREVLDVLDALGRRYGIVLVDLDGSAAAPIAQAVLGVNPTVVGVGLATPVGVVRLLEWMADSRSTVRTSPIHAVLNRAPRDRFRRAEITAELCRANPPSTLVFVPTDHHVEEAAWDGVPVPRGPFVAAVARLAAAITPVAGRREQSRRRTRHESVA
jgi:MinD-like ATPase involved in chromosome partitioning or flagellar assembly